MIDSIVCRSYRLRKEPTKETVRTLLVSTHFVHYWSQFSDCFCLMIRVKSTQQGHEEYIRFWDSTWRFFHIPHTTTQYSSVGSSSHRIPYRMTLNPLCPRWAFSQHTWMRRMAKIWWARPVYKAVTTLDLQHSLCHTWIALLVLFSVQMYVVRCYSMSWLLNRPLSSNWSLNNIFMTMMMTHGVNFDWR